MGKLSLRKKSRRLFLIYFAVIGLILLWNLFHCTEVTWLSRDAYYSPETLMIESVEGGYYAGDSDEEGEEQTAVELLDDKPVTVRVQADSENGISEKARLRGAALLGYENTNNLRFMGEGIRAEVLRAGTQEVLGQGGMLLSSQTPYPADETMVYVAFSEPVSGTAQEELEIRFSSDGLTKHGVFFSGEAAVEADGTGDDAADEDEFFADSEEQEGVLMARLFYEKKVWHPLSSILYFLLEGAAGMFCLLLWSEKKLPLVRKKAKKEYVSARAVDTKGKSMFSGINGLNGMGELKLSVPNLLLLLVVIFLFLFSMFFTWAHVLRKTASSSSIEILVPASEEREIIKVPRGESILQTLVPGQDRLSAAAVRISGLHDDSDEEDSGSDSGEESSSDTGIYIEWKLLDEDGATVLANGSGMTGNLAKAATVLSKESTSEEIKEAAGKYVLLPFNTVVERAAGKNFMLEISVPSDNTGEDNGSEGESLRLYGTSRTNWQAGGSNGLSMEKPMEACLLGIYRNNVFLKGIFIRVCIIVLLMLIGLFFAGRLLYGKTAVMYVVCALCMGMVFSFMTPAYTVSDERTHIDTDYIISNRLLGITDVPGPEKIYKRACDIDSSMNVTMPVTAARYRAVKDGLFRAAEKSDKNKGQSETSAETGYSYPEGRELTACYARTSLENVSILCFLPSAVGFSLARILGRNMITMVMFARWANLLACVLILYFAIRRMPYGAACMAVISLFPKTLQQMASCSYDGIVIAGTYLFIAYCLAAAYDSEFSATDLLVLFLSGFFVASSKGGAYIPVLGLALLIPFARKKMYPESSKEHREIRMLWYSITAALLGGSAILFFGKFITLVVGMFTRTSGSVTSGAGASTRTLYTLSDFIHVPDKLVHIFLNTVNVRGDGLIGELVGKNLSQRWYFIYGFLLLAMLGMLRTRSISEKENGTGNHICAGGRVWILLMASASSALVFLSMLMAFTTRGALYIEGLQGRYFLPIAPLLFLAAETGMVKRDGLEDNHIIYTAAVLLALTFSQILLYYFGGI